MKKSSFDKFLRVPLRYVDDRWECEYGGIVPVSPGTVAELVINSRSITDKTFLDRMMAKSSIKVLDLDEGVTLLAYLATKKQKGLTDEQKDHLIPWQDRLHEIATEHIDNWSTGGLSLVEVTIGGPTGQQARKFNTTSGGLWLLTEGPKAAGLQSTCIRLPKVVSKDPVNSLNHAFTKLSETYEPWRISHTGNIYQRFLYKEKDGKWYPLEILRNAALAKKEQEIAYQLWQDFMKRMSSNKAVQRK
jgi:hypothetical protein